MVSVRNFFLIIFVFTSVFFNAQTCPTLKDDQGNEDYVNILCGYFPSGGSCLTLNADFPVLKSTDKYSVSSIAYSPITPLDSGTPVGVYSNDLYVKRINFSDPIFGSQPFAFSFYGNVYPSLLISSNGFITFNQVFKEGDFSTADITGHAIPDSYLPKESVFGAYQDLNIDKDFGSEIYYKVEGKAPCRTLTITFYNARINGTNQSSTSQIVLHETFNIIDVNVESKPLADTTASLKEALIGLTDDSDGGTSVPNRNNEIFSASQETWRFTPSGKNMQPKYSWYLDGNVIEGRTGNSIDTCLRYKQQVYRAMASYTLSTGVIFDVYKDFEFVYDDTYPLAQDYTKVFCQGDTSLVYQSDFYSFITPNPISNFNFKFYSSVSNAHLNGTPDYAASDPLTKNTTYYVRVESKANPDCYQVGILRLSDPTSMLLTDEVAICDINNDGIEQRYVLKNLICQLFPDGFLKTNPTFYINSNTSPVTYADLTASTKIYVEVETICGKIKYGPISVSFSSSPDLINFSTPISIDDICDVVSNSNPLSREPDFDWVKYFEDHSIALTSDPDNYSIKFFEDYAKAVANKIPLTFIKEGDKELDYIYSVFVRIGSNNATGNCSGSCYSILEVPVRVKFFKVILNVDDADLDAVPDDPEVFDPEVADVYLCKEDSPEVNLQEDAEKIIKITNPVDGAGVSITYHSTVAETQDLTDMIGISPNQTLPTNKLTTTFYVRYRLGDKPEDSCFVVKPLKYHFVDYSNIEDEIEICESKLVNKTVNLSDYVQDILKGYNNQSPKPRVLFYSDSGATNEITTLVLSPTPSVVYAKIDSGYNNSCYEIYPITFSQMNIFPLEKEILDVYISCDNNNNGVEYRNLFELADELVDNSTGIYTFSFYKAFNPNTGGFAQPIAGSLITNYLVADGNVVYVRISGISAICPQKAEIRFHVNITNQPVALNDSAVLLSCGIDNQTSTFDLDKSIVKLYIEDENPPFDSAISSVTYYTTEEGANIGTESTDLIPGNTYAVNVTEPRKEVWARFESVGGCFSVAKVILRIINPFDINPPTDVLEAICDDNLDGTYVFDLEAWLEENKYELIKIDLLNPEDNQEVVDGTDFTFHLEIGGDALTDEEIISFSPNPYTQPYIYLKADFGGCYKYIKLGFDFGDLTIPEFTYPVFCETEPVDLTVFESDALLQPAVSFNYYRSIQDMIAENNAITNPDAYIYEGIPDIFVKIFKPDDCPKQAIIHLPKPKPSPYADNNVINGGRPYEYCPYNSGITIAPRFDIIFWQFKIVYYVWRDPSGNIIAEGSNVTSISNINVSGQYSVTLTASNGCSGTSTFDVVARDVPVITQLIPGENNYVVVAEGTKPLLYAYSYEDANGNIVMSEWQSSRYFDNLPSGAITFYVKYDGEENLEDCWVSARGLIPEFKNVITPNGDGINDTWTFGDLDVFEGEKSTFRVFDRYGKLIYEQSSADQFTWDGRLSNRVLSTTSYWYTVTFPDGRVFNGWIVLKNRD